ncbi:hypothetical protein LCGC14_0219840 [marine sediment metagenome]|uniref:Uncharacterized protein n=1 Tax=marine sediment metagenome TaxID=412755 RepID=A0A0F9UHH8_9ZZZZ
MKETIGFKLKKWIFRFIGDIKWAGMLHPFWFVINATTFRLKGKHYRDVEQIIQPGDILIRRFEGYVDKFLLPGWWNHAGVYVGEIDGQDNKVVHAISDGIVVDDLIDFMRTDHMIVLRAPEKYCDEAIKRAKTVIGRDYDFAFEFGDSLRFSCTELVNYCFGGIVRGKKRFGRFTIVADDIVNTPVLNVIWDSRKNK